MKKVLVVLTMVALTFGMNAQETYLHKFGSTKTYYTISDNEIIVRFKTKSDTLAVKKIQKVKNISVYDIDERAAAGVTYRYTFYDVTKPMIKVQTKDGFSGKVEEQVFFVNKQN